MSAMAPLATDPFSAKAIRCPLLVRLCCKSQKLQGSDLIAKTRNGKQSTIRIISIALPKSPVSFARGDEVPHIFTRKPRLQPAEFLITSAKRLLQHNLPGANIEYQAFWVSNQAPPATKAIPASRGTSLPNGITFSTNTNAERAAI